MKLFSISINFIVGGIVSLRSLSFVLGIFSSKCQGSSRIPTIYGHIFVSSFRSPIIEDALPLNKFVSNFPSFWSGRQSALAKSSYFHVLFSQNKRQVDLYLKTLLHLFLVSGTQLNNLIPQKDILIDHLRPFRIRHTLLFTNTIMRRLFLQKLVILMHMRNRIPLQQLLQLLIFSLEISDDLLIILLLPFYVFLFFLQLGL